MTDRRRPTAHSPASAEEPGTLEEPTVAAELWVLKIPVDDDTAGSEDIAGPVVPSRWWRRIARIRVTTRKRPS